MARDLTEKQFVARLKKYGFGMPEPPLMYVKLPNCTTHVSLLNGGPTLRGKLAYLLECIEREERRNKRLSAQGGAA